MEDKCDRLCCNLILFDIFFVPLFPWFSVSCSLPVLLYWFLVRGHRTSFESERKPLGIVIILMVISTLISLVYEGETQYDTSFFTSIKLCIMFITCFLYFFFFRYIFSAYNRKVDSLVFWCICYIAVFAFFYSVAPEQFNSFKGIIAPFDPQVRRWQDGGELLFRFNFLWADPNNVAYATDALLIYYLIESTDSIIKKYIAILLSVFILFCTMSIGGIGVLMVSLAIIFVLTDIFRGNSYAVFLTIALTIGVFIGVLYFLPTIQELLDTGLAVRIDAYVSSGTAGGGRLGDLTRGLSRFDPILLLIGTGKEGFVTEIGHLYVIFLYGFPVYCYYLYVLYWKRKKIRWIEYLPLMPFFVGFTMNIAIIEQKFLLLNLLVAAYYSSLSAKRVYLSKMKEI